jgi:predicted transcriptional regulator
LLSVGLLLLALPAASARALKTLELDDSIKYGQMSTVFDGGVRGLSVTEVWDAVKIIHTRMLSFH